MQIICECRIRAAILAELAAKWLALAILSEQFGAGADRVAHKLPTRH